MGQMIVRNIPDDVMERFKKAAKAQGKSAEAFAREVIEEKAKPSREELNAKINAVRARSKPIKGFDLVGEIRKDRDRDRVWEVLNGSDN